MSVSERKLREQEMRRKVILESAHQLFKEKGFEASTVDEIALRAELGKGTIYSYFKSKEEIYFKIIESEFEILNDRLQLAVKDTASAEKALYKIYDTYINYHKEYSGYIGSFCDNDFVSDKKYLKLSDLITGLKSRSKERTEIISNALRFGIENGEFINFDIQKVTKLFSSLIIGLIIALESGQIEEDLSNYRETVFSLLLNGIKKL